MKKFRVLIIATVVVCVLVPVGFLLAHLKRPAKVETVGWREDFNSARRDGKHFIPEGWRVKGKPGTKTALFSVVNKTGEGDRILRAKADNGSATLLYRPKNVDLKETPVLRWRWKAITLPEGADGRQRARDDQAMGIYVGTGSIFNNKSVSYRWDTETPRGSQGNVSYGGGTVDVKWFTLRNKEDLGSGRWFVEERNIAEDFKKAWGFYPKKIYLGISCNSQYTDSKAVSDIDWIEFVSISKNI